MKALLPLLLLLELQLGRGRLRHVLTCIQGFLQVLLKTQLLLIQQSLLVELLFGDFQTGHEELAHEWLKDLQQFVCGYLCSDNPSILS